MDLEVSRAIIDILWSKGLISTEESRKIKEKVTETLSLKKVKKVPDEM